MSVVLHVPHDSTRIPEAVRRGIVLDDEALARELLASTDHHTADLVRGLDVDGVRLHVNGLSRLVVDPERFLDPQREETEAVGRGAVYTRGFDGTVLRDTSGPDWPRERADLISSHYTPYHTAFDDLVGEVVDTHGECTIIDVHSYPQHAQPYELHPDGDRPEVCIGTDETHTPPWLADTIADHARAMGLTTASNTPFRGTFVPTPLLGDARVRSVMIEIRRDTYCDEATAEPHAGMDRIRELLRRTVATIAERDRPTTTVSRPGRHHSDRMKRDR